MAGQHRLAGVIAALHRGLDPVAPVERAVGRAHARVKQQIEEGRQKSHAVPDSQPRTFRAGAGRRPAPPAADQTWRLSSEPRLVMAGALLPVTRLFWNKGRSALAPDAVPVPLAAACASTW